MLGEPWYSLTDTQQVHPWMLDRPSDVNGFTNAAMAWMPKSGHGADGRLANYHGLPFQHWRSL
ncbi:hypothetical protein [Shewanella mangrovisoli]|uniref:hypothetical protein n=1 Tax=Shewanella mangrovisoli TaxID=2864211 RepID=UPI0035B85412